jgi:D-arabinose 1-dehydrogenase-like Zn-dependent alcohol dehydrogenase
MQSAEGGDEAESTMMRSARIVGPSQLEIASVSVPSPPDGHCLVRVDAAALNPTDVKHLASGMSYYGAAKASATAPVPFGSEGSGVVVIAAGGFSVGDEVCFLMDKMRTERSKPCEGSLSDYVCVHPLHMAKIWKGASLDDAAGTPLALLTAYLLRTKCMYRGYVIYFKGVCNKCMYLCRIKYIMRRAGTSCFGTGALPRRAAALESPFSCTAARGA